MYTAGLGAVPRESLTKHLRLLSGSLFFLAFSHIHNPPPPPLLLPLSLLLSLNMAEMTGSQSLNMAVQPEITGREDSASHTAVL